MYNSEALVEVTLDEHHDFFTSFMNQVGASVLSKQHLELKGIYTHLLSVLDSKKKKKNSWEK